MVRPPSADTGFGAAILAAVASDVVFARARRRHKHQGIDFEIKAASQYRER